MLRHRMSWLAAGMVALCVVTGAAQVSKSVVSTIIYVKHDATGANSGVSWQDAFTDLQSALAVAQSGQGIWVAAGIYKPTAGFDRTVSFQLVPDVAIYGGFNGTETSPEQRDWVGNVTILSGDIGTEGSSADNVYHVVRGAGGADNATLDGFTITAGNANAPLGDDHGRRAGGLYNDGVALTVRNCVFTGNYGINGGAMMNRNGAAPLIEHCVFVGNSARYGAAIQNDVVSPTIRFCRFLDNTATEQGGAMHGWGPASTVIDHCLFSGNTASHEGGALIFLRNNTPILTNCTITGNSADRGGAIFNHDNSSSAIKNAILWNNTSTSGGDEIFNNDTSTSVVTYTCIAGGHTGTGNLDTDPLFANPSGDDYHLKSQGGRYDPSLGAASDPGAWVVDVEHSPCLDTGDPASDYSLEPENNGDHINMGAYGNTAEASKSTTHNLLAQSTPITGVDITGDPAQAGGTTEYSVDITKNTAVGLTAPANAGGMVFVQWEDNLGNPLTTDLTLLLTMDADKTVAARYGVTMTFRAVTVNVGLHNPMTAGNCPTVEYVEPGGATAYASPCDGHDVIVDVEPGSTYTYDQTSSGSNSSHRWYCNETPLGGTAPATGSETATKNYYEQYHKGFTTQTVSPGTPLDLSNCVMVTYEKSGSPGQYGACDGHVYVDWTDAGSTYVYNRESELSGPSERWRSEHEITGTVTDDTTISGLYYHQHKPTVHLAGTDVDHTAGIEEREVFGAVATVAGLFGDWTDWCDDGCMLTFSEYTTGTPPWRTTDARTWTVESAFEETITYGEQLAPTRLYVDPEVSYVRTGNVFHIDVNLEDVPPFKGIEFTLCFDPSVVQLNGNPVQSPWVNQYTAIAWPTAAAMNASGCGTFTMGLFPPGAPSSGAGTVVELEFEAMGGEADFPTEITLSASAIAYMNADPVAHTTDDGIIEWQPCRKGDFDGDEDVDFWDFMRFIDVYNLHAGDPGWAPNGPAGDFDDDDDVDFWDFMAFIGVYGT